MENARNVLARIYELFESAVLTIVPLREKGPKDQQWHLSFAQTQQPEYQGQLLVTAERGGNIGVEEGPPSGLVAININLDSEVDVFFALNPALKDTLTTRGASGCSLWYRPLGEYPVLRVSSGKKIPDSYIAVAEFRGGGGSHSII